VREEFLPVVELERIFQVQRSGGEREDAVMVVIESGGVRVAALVDDLLGQQQVVVKNLESNYGPVDNVSGATIMGDGRVALILDVDALVRRARH
jgi:two-component system chemotaxis sensor kinase CheA